jgi:hypothetical protein
VHAVRGCGIIAVLRCLTCAGGRARCGGGAGGVTAAAAAHAQAHAASLRVTLHASLHTRRACGCGVLVARHAWWWRQARARSAAESGRPLVGACDRLRTTTVDLSAQLLFFLSFFFFVLS